MNKIALMIAGVTSGSGKTTITQGILALLVKNNYRVQSFKLGPDYIDSGYHSAITGKPCVNLDKFLLSPDDCKDAVKVIKDHFYSYSTDAEALVIEAVGGIFDDWYHDGNNPAQIALDLGVNVILVADGFSYCQTLGIMLNPIFEYKKELNISGLIINKVSSQEHYSRIIETLSEKHKRKAIGYISGSEDLFINERHLGLMTAPELKHRSSKIPRLAEIFSKSIDLEKLISNTIEIPSKFTYKTSSSSIKKCRIAVAKDKAFSFYYAYNLSFLEELGAELVHFSTLSDFHLPENISGIYLGGGFPEVYASELNSNCNILNEIKNNADNGMPIYAECGGLIYLGKSINKYKTDKSYSSVEIFDIEASFTGKLVLSYVTGKLDNNCLIGDVDDKIKGHIFHRTNIEELSSVPKSTTLKILSNDIEIKEGYSYKNVYASYLHLHFLSCPKVAQNLILKAIQYKNCR
ncbi:MAG TPA: cobyrinate a,c-diamide synthase [Victivallales bacterium]|nr:cobyrinate a,c-diamide synthase [Victivallales bacterium]